MNHANSLSLITATAQTVVRMYYGLDRRDYAGAASCFTPDGVWEVATATLRGPDQIVTALSRRPETLFTRHYVSNFLILDERASVVRAAFALTVHRSDKGEPPVLPINQTAPAMLADVECELVCGDDGHWRIGRLEPRITFAA